MTNESAVDRARDEGLPTPHLLRAAIQAVRVLDRERGTRELDAHHAYAELPTGGIFQSADLLAAERVLLRAGLITHEQDRLVPAMALLDAAALDEPESLEALLFMILERRPPLWLTGAAGNGELHTEAIPDEVGALIEEVIPDLARREAILLAAGRRHDNAALAALGALGEEHVVDACRAELASLGHPELGDRVRRVSLQSDQLGWDVDAPRVAGGRRKLEVKTSRAPGPAVRFHLSRNEARIGQQDPDWALVFCRADREDQVEIVGWCGMAVVTPLLPLDQEQNGRWESVLVTIDERKLEAGLPPAK
jgi:hypothetical protein